MSEKINNDQIDYNDLDGILIKMDLRTLGELAADIVKTWCSYRGQDSPLLYDNDGKLTEDAKVIAGSAWTSVLRMNDRREFAESVFGDLDSLPQQ